MNILDIAIVKRLAGGGGSGTVTSVSVQGGSGSHLTGSGNPIETSGTITIDVDEGYSIPSNNKQNAWDIKAADLKFEINSSTFVITAQLKDSNGNLIGHERTIDLPLESVVVNGAYDDQTKKVILTLQNGNTIEFSVADLVSGLQTELNDTDNKLNPDYIAYDASHRAVSDTEKDTWNAKQNAISDLETIRSGAAAGATAVQPATMSEALAAKQNSLNTAQLAAVNSGIDSDDVAQISTNQTNISSVQNTVNILKMSEFNNAFGMKISKSDTNPNTKVSYMFNAEGMTPAYMDFTGGSFNFGGFSSWKPVSQNRPVALNFDGSVAYELNHTDFSKKLDNTASDITDATATMNFMSEMPLMYIRRWEDENYNYIVFCEYQTNENYTADAFKNASGGIGSKLYLPMFKGSYVDGKLRSLAKQYWQNNADVQGSEAEWNAAAACGTGWQTWDWAKREYLSDLMTFITKSTDWKNKFGRGVTNRSTSNGNKYDGQPTGGYCSTSGDLTTWTADYHGQFYGVASTTSDKKHVTAFYVEDPYGNRWERTPGLELYNNVYRAKMSPPYALTDSASRAEYDNLGISAPAEGWFKTASTSMHGSVPVAVGASETTGYCSYFYRNASGVRLALFGGACGYGGACGRYVNLSNAPSVSYWVIGASPCFVSP